MAATPVMSNTARMALKGAARDLHAQFRGVFGEETIESLLLAATRNWPPPPPSITGCVSRRAVRPPAPGSPRARGEPRRREGPVGAVLVRAQRRALADGARLVRPPRRGPGHRLVRRVRARGARQPGAVAAMAEAGIDISREFPKPWTEEFVLAADVVVTMGCGDACPLLPGKHYEDWELDDPAGKTIEEIRPIRDEIRDRVDRPATAAGRPLTPGRPASGFAAPRARSSVLMTSGPMPR